MFVIMKVVFVLKKIQMMGMNWILWIDKTESGLHTTHVKDMNIDFETIDSFLQLFPCNSFMHSIHVLQADLERIVFGSLFASPTIRFANWVRVFASPRIFAYSPAGEYSAIIRQKPWFLSIFPRKFEKISTKVEKNWKFHDKIRENSTKIVFFGE